MPTNKPEVVLPELPSCHTFQHPERLYTAEQLRAYGQACIDTLTRPADGDFVMVPREPTQAMVAAGNEASDWHIRDADDVYRAMLSAAPQQHGQEVEYVCSECVYRGRLNARGACPLCGFKPKPQQPAEAVAEYQYRNPGAHDDSWRRMTREEYEASIATGHCCGIASWTKNFELRKLYTTPTTDQQPEAAAVELDGTDSEVLREFIRLCREVKPVGQWPGERVCAAIERSMANEKPFRFIAEADMAPERGHNGRGGDADRLLSGPRRSPPPALDTQQQAEAVAGENVTIDGRHPTHYCNQCGALWLSSSEHWSLVSSACGKCCDNAPMGGSIKPLLRWREWPGMGNVLMSQQVEKSLAKPVAWAVKRGEGALDFDGCDLGEPTLAEREELGRNIPGAQFVPLYLAPPPAIDIGKLRELVARWRGVVESGEAIGYSAAEVEVMTAMTEELAALIGDGGERADG